MWGAAGAAATRMVPAIASRWIWPAIPVVGPQGLAVKAGAAVVAGMLTSQFWRKSAGDDVALGGLIIVADEIARTYVYPQIPLPGLQAYLQPGMGAYVQPGMGQYLNPGAVTPALPPAGNDLMDYYSDPEDSLAGPDDMPVRLDATSRL
jgi:hypothetical protein